MNEPTRIELVSTSRAGDGGYLAAADLAEIAAELNIDYRLIGGNAVSLLAAIHDVTDLVPGARQPMPTSPPAMRLSLTRGSPKRWLPAATPQWPATASLEFARFPVSARRQLPAGIWPSTS